MRRLSNTTGKARLQVAGGDIDGGGDLCCENVPHVSQGSRWRGAVSALSCYNDHNTTNTCTPQYTVAPIVFFLHPINSVPRLLSENV